MKDKINKFFTFIQGSFDTHSKSASARKLTAFVMVLCVLALHVWYIRFATKNADMSLLPTILGLDFGFIATLLGMTTYENIKGRKENDQPGDKQDS